MSQLANEEAEVIHILERYSCSASHRMQGVIRYMEWYSNLIRQAFCQTVQKRTTAGKIYTALYDI